MVIVLQVTDKKYSIILQGGGFRRESQLEAVLEEDVVLLRNKIL